MIGVPQLPTTNFLEAVFLDVPVMNEVKYRGENGGFTLLCCWFVRHLSVRLRVYVCVYTFTQT